MNYQRVFFQTYRAYLRLTPSGRTKWSMEQVSWGPDNTAIDKTTHGATSGTRTTARCSRHTRQHRSHRHLSSVDDGRWWGTRRVNNNTTTAATTTVHVCGVTEWDCGEATDVEGSKIDGSLSSDDRTSRDIIDWHRAVSSPSRTASRQWTVYIKAAMTDYAASVNLRRGWRHFHHATSDRLHWKACKIHQTPAELINAPVAYELTYGWH